MATGRGVPVGEDVGEHRHKIIDPGGTVGSQCPEVRHGVLVQHARHQLLQQLGKLLGHYKQEQPYQAPITPLTFHPSSNLLAIGSADFSVKIVTSSFKGSNDPFVVSSKVERHKEAENYHIRHKVGEY